MDAATRNLVRRRAQDRCEYCRLPESAADIPFHVEHIIARQHLGSDDSSNLCLACDRCNLHKGPNLTSIDPVTRQIIALFNPREHIWAEHFVLRDAEIIGISDIGRTTVRLLNMNAKRRVDLRLALLTQGVSLE